MKNEFIQIRNLAKMICLSEGTLKNCLSNYLLCKYRMADKFYLHQESLNILYTYLYNKSKKYKKFLEATKLFKQNYPNVEKMVLEKI